MRIITSNPPQEVDLNKQDCIIYSLFMQGYTYHEIFGLLIFLACGACCIAIFSSALTTTLWKKEACFLMAEKSGKTL